MQLLVKQERLAKCFENGMGGWLLLSSTWLAANRYGLLMDGRSTYTVLILLKARFQKCLKDVFSAVNLMEFIYLQKLHKTGSFWLRDMQLPLYS